MEYLVSVLQNWSGYTQPVSDWTISAIEIERGKKIGTGGYSVVYEGTYLGAAVAIKELFPQTSSRVSRAPFDHLCVDVDLFVWHSSKLRRKSGSGKT